MIFSFLKIIIQLKGCSLVILQVTTGCTKVRGYRGSARLNLCRHLTVSSPYCVVSLSWRHITCIFCHFSSALSCTQLWHYTRYHHHHHSFIPVASLSCLEGMRVWHRQIVSRRWQTFSSRRKKVPDVTKEKKGKEIMRKFVNSLHYFHQRTLTRCPRQ